MKIFLLSIFFLLIGHNAIIAQNNKITIEPDRVLRTAIGKPLYNGFMVFGTENYSKYRTLGLNYERKIANHFSGALSLYMLDFRKYGTTDQILFASNYTESRNKKGLKLQVRAYVNKEVNGWLGGTYYHGISETYRKSISFSTPETGTNQYNILGFLAGYSHVGKKGLILESIFFLGKDINIPDLEASYLDFNLQLNIGYSF